MSRNNRMLLFAIPVLLGLLFCFYYIHATCLDVAYTDYIRLIINYLPDVDNPKKFFVPDILTRVPLTYLMRLVNVRLLGYNTLFDITLGVLSLGLGAWALARWAAGRREISLPAFLLLMAVLFDLNQWEMLTNGTGWVCYLSISGFYYHYTVIDHAAATHCSSSRDRVQLVLLPALIILLAAGQYCGGYAVILVLTYTTLIASDFVKRRKLAPDRKIADFRLRRRIRTWGAAMASVLLSMSAYLLSNHYAVYEHRTYASISLIPLIKSDPLFFPLFLIKAFSADIVGVDSLHLMQDGGLPGQALVLLLGLMVIGLYLWSLQLNIRHRLWEKTLLPLTLILSGGVNHILIIAARWPFHSTDYGMSSRYALQYKMGVIGILLTFILVFYRSRRAALRGWILGAMAFIFLGSVVTTRRELIIAPYRMEFQQQAMAVGQNYRNETDDRLSVYFQHEPAKIRKALGILEENQLNIFRPERRR